MIVTQEKQGSKVKYSYKEIINAIHSMHEEHVTVEANLQEQIKQHQVYAQQQEYLLHQVEKEQAKLIERYNSVRNQLHESKENNEKQTKMLQEIEKKQARLLERNESLQIRLKDSEMQRDKLHEHLRNLKLDIANLSKSNIPKPDMDQQPNKLSKDVDYVKQEPANQSNVTTASKKSDISTGTGTQKVQNVENDMFLTRNPFASDSFWKEKIASWKDGGE